MTGTHILLIVFLLHVIACSTSTSPVAPVTASTCQDLEPPFGADMATVLAWGETTFGPAQAWPIQSDDSLQRVYWSESAEHPLFDGFAAAVTDSAGLISVTALLRPDTTTLRLELNGQDMPSRWVEHEAGSRWELIYVEAGRSIFVNAVRTPLPQRVEPDSVVTDVRCFPPNREDLALYLLTLQGSARVAPAGLEWPVIGQPIPRLDSTLPPS